MVAIRYCFIAFADQYVYKGMVDSILAIRGISSTTTRIIIEIKTENVNFSPFGSSVGGFAKLGELISFSYHTIGI